MATKNTAPVSLLDKLRDDKPELFGGVQFTPEIFIPYPTKATCEKIAAAENETEVAELILGNQIDAIDAVLAELPLAAAVNALAALIVAVKAGIPDVEQAFTDQGLSKADFDAMFADKE
ncbi:hypothetical protein L3Y19_gp025 [Gordonia phage Neville]|uniref:Uncharacterized protein n=2 Tax=Nevillevirus TaxID=3044773 RepID=A0A515MGV8_9CAUD|nr:hypothetical protein L3Y19_gp025 [Gordonia phage Neville]YP_010246010.1 hypothetical protein L3Y20_gp025 [Gordonia phage Trax]AXQ64397.1 hypothetical protein SEA_NEVILLE_25 [Gordonia phage Neville]QDM55912.1 hypothetical protein SEA_TRAX_25 [Gordonia phage Trax]